MEDFNPYLVALAAIVSLWGMYVWLAREKRSDGGKAFYALPSPPGVFILGHALSMVDAIKKKDLISLFNDWADTYGGLFRLNIGGEGVAVADPVLVMQIMKDRPTYFSRDAQQSAVFAGGRFNGVFAVNNDAWRRHRRLTSPSLSNANVIGVLPKVNVVARQLLEKWGRLSKDGVVSILTDCSSFATDTAFFALCNHNFNSLATDHEDEGSVLHAARLLTDKLLLRVLDPFQKHKFITDKEFELAGDKVDALLEDVITKCANGMEGYENCLLKHLIESSRKEGRSGLNTTELVGNVKLFTLAGLDTVASVLAFCLYDIAKYKDVRINAQKEQDALAKGTTADEVTPDQLSKMPLTVAIIKESMRMHYPTPLIIHQVEKPTSVGGVPLKRGDKVFVITGKWLKDEKYFANPNEFLPERWLDIAADGTEGSEKDNTVVHELVLKSFLPFGYGPRRCPGQALAMEELLVCVSLLLRKFDISLPEGAPEPKTELGFAVMPDAVNIMLKERSK